MDRAELAARLVAADDTTRAWLLARYQELVDVDLAYEIKLVYDDAESGDSNRAAAAAAALVTLAARTADPAVAALADWTAGLVALDAGRLDDALRLLDHAEERFNAIGQPRSAAAVDVGKLIALAMLGRYDEAIACGTWARDTFLADGNALAAGKIEQNLGNIYWRRGGYSEAERLYCAARERFAVAGDQKELARVHNNLANVLALRHQFRAAAQLYEQALANAQSAGLDVTQAEIECNLGCCALDQAHYDRALDYLERARRRYAALGLRPMAARAELELADAYLELNMAGEAAPLYARIVPIFAEAGMRAEQARATANHGRACLRLGQAEQARAQLSAARALYEAEGNPVGAAHVMLAAAEVAAVEGDFDTAGRLAAQAERALAAAGSAGGVLLARWALGESLRAHGQLDRARQVLEAALRDSERQGVPQIGQRCHTSLGLLAAAIGDAPAAEASFSRAVSLIEELRAPLPAEEFRIAFVADKLTPYAGLARLCLADRTPARTAEALGYVERARARALVDLLGGAVRLRRQPADQYEAELLEQLAALREDLNSLYSQITRPRDADLLRGTQSQGAYAAARARETQILAITRQLQQRAAVTSWAEMIPQAQSLDLAALQRQLGPQTGLVEYFSLDGEMLAFVVTDEHVDVVRDLGRDEQVAVALQQLHFQIGALRQGTTELDPYLDELAARTRHHLAALHNLLLGPLEPRLGARRMVVVPHRALYYVPFHALYDGHSYTIERREVCYAPSAAALGHCLARPRRPLRSATLLAFADAQSPWSRDEVRAIAPLFPEATVLLDEQATLAALRAHAPSADVLHLACHGQFRPDHPLFSSLRLADGWLTVRDTYTLDLGGELVTLSGCETGLSEVAPGDELIGLVRGFFSAGAPTLIVSLWPVDDRTTASLMAHFYARLRAGTSAAAALRAAQRELLSVQPHPFFWSPFVLFGRW